MRATLAIFAIALSSSAQAEVAVSYPVPVPQECVELALREGVPTLIQNKYQALKAQYKLARLKSTDPMVSECRAAVARAKQAAHFNEANNVQR